MYASGDPLSRVDANGMWDGSAIGGNYLSSTFGGITSSINSRDLMADIRAQQYLTGLRDTVNPIHLLPFATTIMNYADNKPYAANLAMDVASIIPFGKIAGSIAKPLSTVKAVNAVKALQVGQNLENTVKVTSWAGKNMIPDLNRGRWVMKGEANLFNYLKTFLWGPRYDRGIGVSRGVRYRDAPSITGYVRADQLKWPEGMDSFRGLFGQRQIR